MSRLSDAVRLERQQRYQEGLLWCASCKGFLPIGQFYPRKKGRNFGYFHYCKVCEYNRQCKVRRRQYYENRFYPVLDEAIELMGGKCQRCSYYAHRSSMEFHHVYPSEKSGSVGALLNNTGLIEGAWEEMDKCCLLCSNCHQEYGAGVWRNEFIKRKPVGYTIGHPLPLDDARYEADTPPIDKPNPIPSQYQINKPKQLNLLDRRIEYLVTQ